MRNHAAIVLSESYIASADGISPSLSSPPRCRGDADRRRSIEADAFKLLLHKRVRARVQHAHAAPPPFSAIRRTMGFCLSFSWPFDLHQPSPPVMNEARRRTLRIPAPESIRRSRRR